MITRLVLQGGSLSTKDAAAAASMEQAWGVKWAVGHTHFATHNGLNPDGSWRALPLVHPTQPSTPYYVLPIADALWKRGELLIVTWGTCNLSVPDPANPGKNKRSRMEPADVIAGKYDTYWHQSAKTLIAWKHPIIFALNAEFNLASSPWYMEPADFVQVWRYVVSLFRKDGATNVSWAWIANQLARSGNSATTAEDKLGAYYPGDEYVDFTGADVYNWATSSTPPSSWLTFRQIMTGEGNSYGDTYGTIARTAPTKPIIIGEVGSHTAPGDQAAWITDMLGTLPTAFPLVSMLSYYGLDDGEAKWSLSTPESVAAWSGGILRGPYARGNEFPMPPDMQTLSTMFEANTWGDQLTGLAEQVRVARVQVDVLNTTNAAQAVALVELQAQNDSLEAQLEQSSTDLEAAQLAAIEAELRAVASEASMAEITGAVRTLTRLSQED